jgi:CRP-like cAMP-binding protein
LKSTYSYAKDQEIYRYGQAATFCYHVINGAVRIMRKLTNGRRQVGAFYFAGDIFGFEPSSKHRWSAEAIVEATTVRRLLGRKALLEKASMRPGAMAPARSSSSGRVGLWVEPPVAYRTAHLDSGQNAGL